MKSKKRKAEAPPSLSPAAWSLRGRPPFLRGRVPPDDPNPYVRRFGRGIPYIAFRMKAGEGLDIPVVPLSIFGTQRAWGIPGKIRVNVGLPLYIRDFLGGDINETVERFRAALQEAVERLLVESLRNPFSSG